jgi:hypothetical protein
MNNACSVSSAAVPPGIADVRHRRSLIGLVAKPDERAGWLKSIKHPSNILAPELALRHVLNFLRGAMLRVDILSSAIFGNTR